MSFHFASPIASSGGRAPSACPMTATSTWQVVLFDGSLTVPAVLATEALRETVEWLWEHREEILADEAG